MWNKVPWKDWTGVQMWYSSFLCKSVQFHIKKFVLCSHSILNFAYFVCIVPIEITALWFTNSLQTHILFSNIFCDKPFHRHRFPLKYSNLDDRLSSMLLSGFYEYRSSIIPHPFLMLILQQHTNCWITSTMVKNSRFPLYYSPLEDLFISHIVPIGYIGIKIGHCWSSISSN